MTEIQNPKQLAFDLICDLDIEYWNLFGPILRSGGACDLEFKQLVLVICYFQFIRVR
jgi:hypothetical protein